jgi:hypothetical protein
VGALVMKTKNFVFLAEVWMLIEGTLTIFIFKKNFVSVAAMSMLSG